MNNNFLKNKSTRTKVFTAITALAVIVLLALNYLITYFISGRALYVDMTPEGLYSLSDEMKSECAFIKELDDKDKELEIIFCNDPDKLTSSTVTRVPYFMALQMEREYENLSVRTVNVTYNPTALAKYKTTSLTQISPSDIIVSYGSTYRIISAKSLWMVTDQDTYFSYNGEYKMASLIMSVTAVNKPAAYFTVGHGETYYDASNPESEGSIASAALYDLLSARGFNVGVVDLSREQIPDDCAILIINDPKSDFTYDKSQSAGLFYYDSETRKIDRYLRKNQGALMVARDYDSSERGSLENLDAFLYEWGFAFGDCSVTDGKNHVGAETDTDKIIGVYDTESDSYANAIYGEFASLASAPNTVFMNTGYLECSFYETDVRQEDGSSEVTLTYNSFMTSYSTATAKDKSGADVKKDECLDLAAVTVRYKLDEYTNEAEYSYVFCANSADFFSNELLYNNSYANYDIASALINNISRIDMYASVNLGGTSLNSPKYGGKQLVYDTLSDTASTVYNGDGTRKETIKALTPGAKRAAVIISVAVPVIPLAICIVVKTRRKYL